MASRYYLPVSGAPPVSPALDASWQVNTATPARVQMVTTKSGTDVFASVGPISEGSVAATRNVFFRQYISEPIRAQTITGTITGWIRSLENSLAADANGQLVVRVVSGDGATVRGTLLAAATTTTVTNEFTGSLTTRLFPGSGGTLTSVDAQNGDRIVIEVGVRGHSVNTTAYTYTLQFGQRSDTGDATGSGGAGTTNPWLEFSQTIEPASAGTTLEASGTASGTSSTAGAATIAVKLAGTSTGAGSATGSARMAATASGVASGTSTLSGNAATTMAVDATSAGASTLTGDATMDLTITASAGGSATVDAYASMDVVVSGTAAGTADVTGWLDMVTGPVAPPPTLGTLTRTPQLTITATRTVHAGLTATRTAHPAMTVTREALPSLFAIARTPYAPPLAVARIPAAPPLAINRTPHAPPLAVNRAKE